MKLTVGMACCGNYEEVWFTVQALRLYQDLTDTEIVIVDQSDDDKIGNWVKSWACQAVRYFKFTDAKGTAVAKDYIFTVAKGEWVIVLDSHVLLAPGVLFRFREWADKNPTCMDLLHGPMFYDDLKVTADRMDPVWRGQMWGTWHTNTPDVNAEPYEIEMHGMGLFACRRDAWLRFNPAFRGFGGEEGYIHTKYRKAGRRVMCLPFLRWDHHFRTGATPYRLSAEDKIHNYLTGFRELGLDDKPVREHFKIP